MRGSAKLSPTSSIIPPVAGITPRKIAWTAAKCSICLKANANRQVIVALGKSIPASETTIPQGPPSFLPIRTVSATRLMPGVRMHKFQRRINSSIDSHLCFSINARCIKNVVDAPPPKDCRPTPPQMPKTSHLPGLGSCSFIFGVVGPAPRSQYQCQRNGSKTFHFSPPASNITSRVYRHWYEEAQPCRIQYRQRVQSPLLARL